MHTFVKDRDDVRGPGYGVSQTKDPFMRLRRGPWDPKLDLPIGKQVKLVARASGVPLVSK